MAPLRAGCCLLALAAASGAAAQDMRAWQSLHEGLLIEAADGNLREASALYAGLVAGMDPDDPVRAQLLYWLGRARYGLGDAAGARDALVEASQDPAMHDRSLALLGQIDAMELQVHRLPLHYDFAQGTGHWLHTWERLGKGRISIATLEGEPVMSWETTVTEHEDDWIELRFDHPEPPPRRFELSMRTGTIPAFVLFDIFDDKGRRYTAAGPVTVPASEWIRVDLRLRDFLPPEGGGRRARPSAVTSFDIRDDTAFFSPDRGANTIYVKDAAIE